VQVRGEVAAVWQTLHPPTIAFPRSIAHC
jgi:hypothetical protein